jgi:2-polyprenyl-6-methoxyphenol hydroxylase-like FAD-dependent oxidoreductase
MKKPVLVAGAGPVGLTLAAELARYKIPVRIIDKAPARTDKSKALGVWARTLELLDRAGCTEAFISAGLKATSVSISKGAEILARVGLDGIDSDFKFLLLIPQSESERLLEEHLHSLGGKVERNVELTGFSDLGEAVSCTVRHPDGGFETLEASWLIGCDGAHSMVRHALGMRFEGDTLPAHFVLADIHVSGLELPPAELAMFWHPDGVVVFFPIAAGRYRIIADVGCEPQHDPGLDEVQAIVDRRCPAWIVLTDPIWLAGFGVNERKVRDYRCGRVFVAGDAAHVHSPAGGQGMNTGMQDAFNLAWKLALVVQGDAGTNILDSYSVERSAVAKQILADSGRMTQVAMVKNHLGQNLRNFVAHRLLGFSTVQHAMADRLSEITIGYPESPLNAGSARAAHGPAPGARMIGEEPFGAGETPRFALIAKESAKAQALMQNFSRLLEPALRTPTEPGIWLVRPDGYVAAVAHEDDWKVIATCLSKIKT